MQIRQEKLKDNLHSYTTERVLQHEEQRKSVRCVAGDGKRMAEPPEHLSLPSSLPVLVQFPVSGSKARQL